MKIPNKFHGFGEDLEIIQLPKDELTCKKCGEEMIGRYEPDTKKIYVAIDDENNTPQQILLHELGHYYSMYYGLGSGEFQAESFAKFVESIIKQTKLK